MIAYSTTVGALASSAGDECLRAFGDLSGWDMAAPFMPRAAPRAAARGWCVESVGGGLGCAEKWLPNARAAPERHRAARPRWCWSSTSVAPWCPVEVQHSKLYDSHSIATTDERLRFERMSSTRWFQETLVIDTPGKGFTNITSQLSGVVARSGLRIGQCLVFVRHTSASLVIQENADPAVLRDLERWMSELVPEGRAWEHDDEGPDDMPAHARGVLTRTSELIPFSAGRLSLGTWQGVYLWEHRAHPHRRELIVQINGSE